jgi:hypothetical protein
MGDDGQRPCQRMRQVQVQVRDTHEARTRHFAFASHLPAHAFHLGQVTAIEIVFYYCSSVVIGVWM